MDYLNLLRLSRSEIQKRVQDAINWYRNISQRLFSGRKPGTPPEPEKDYRSYKDGFGINGNMFLFDYDAKWKEVLPYWDMKPLIFPLGPAKGGFYGLNLHYLPPQQRAVLLNAMKAQLQTGDSPELYRLMINYQTLIVNPSRFPGFENCVKHYLQPRAQNFQRIDPRDWEHVVMLPLQRWVVKPGFSPPY
jgi:hypothetical protein